jgi:hypothetical protein
MNKRAVGGALGLLAGTTVVSGITVFKSVAKHIQDGSTVAIAQDVRDFWTVTIVLGVAALLVVLGCIPSSYLARILARQFPAALVLLGTSYTEVREALHVASGSTGPIPLHLSFAVVADDVGLVMWIGFLKPRILCQFEWASIADICVQDVRVGLTFVPMLSLTIGESQPSTLVEFGVRSESALSVTNRKRPAIEKLAESLKALRTAARTHDVPGAL